MFEAKDWFVPQVILHDADGEVSLRADTITGAQLDGDGATSVFCGSETFDDIKETPGEVERLRREAWIAARTLRIVADEKAEQSTV